MTFAEGHSDSTFSNFFCSETARLIEAKFHMEPPWDVGNKICSNVPGHMTMPIYGEKQLLRNQEADDLETWYTASGTRVLPMFSYDDPGLTMTILMTGSDFFPNASAWVNACTALSASVFPSLF